VVSKRTTSGIPVATPLAILAIASAALLALAFPLTGTLGPEAAQILSVVGGPALFLAAAARGALRHERGYVGDLVVQALVLVVAFVAFVTIVGVGGLGRETCAPERGLVPLFVLALPVLALGSTSGLLLGRLIPSSRIAVVTGVIVLLALAGWSVLDWTLEPSFRVLTHLFVAIPGDMLEGQSLVGGQVTFRFATAIFATAFAFFGLGAMPPTRRGAGLAGGRRSGPAFLVAGTALFVVALVVDAIGVERLGKSLGDLDDDYALVRTRGDLIVRADPRATNVRDVDATLAEGALWLDRLKERMGVAPSQPITVWLHADASTMERYTGARHVHFALPSRRELHIAGVAVPHPSLGHELVHVLGAELTDALLGVPARIPLVMHAGLVEGTAMALTPELEIKDGLTLREQAAALRRAGLAPPLEELFDDRGSLFSFWRHAPGRAYVTSGALIEALLAAKGAEGLATVYREASLGAAFADDEERKRFLTEHEVALDGMELPADAVHSVRAIFARPSILEETCDQSALDEAVAIRALAREGKLDEAAARARAAEGDAAASATLVSLADEARVLDDDRANVTLLREAARVSVDEDPRVHAARLQLLGDALWRTGQRVEAVSTWERVDAVVLAPYPARLLLARRVLSEAVRASGGRSELAEHALAFILRDTRDADDTQRLARFVAALERAPSSTSPELLAFSRYLVARQAIQRGDHDAGLATMLSALERQGALGAAFVDEALRGVATAHAKRGDHDIAAVAFDALAERATRTASRVELRDRRERAARAARGKDAPRTDVVSGDRHLLGLGDQGGI